MPPSDFTADTARNLEQLLRDLPLTHPDARAARRLIRTLRDPHLGKAPLRRRHALFNARNLAERLRSFRKEAP